jgi:hypothetical protein
MDKESAARLGVPHPSEVTILPTTVGVNTADRNIVSHDHDNGLFTYVAKPGVIKLAVRPGQWDLVHSKRTVDPR